VQEAATDSFGNDWRDGGFPGLNALCNEESATCIHVPVAPKVVRMAREMVHIN
jgi:hypothetical protein